MAFILQHRWHAGDGAEAAAGGPQRVAGEFATEERTRRVRKAAGTLLSACVHAGLIWVFMTKLAGGVDPRLAGDAAPGAGPLTFDLGGAPSKAEEAAASETAPPAPAEAETEVDLTAATDAPPPEWTVSRIVAAPAPRAAAPAAPAIFAAAASGTGGSGGEGPYDPYAGAAPMRREQSGVPNGAASGGVALDAEVLALLRRAVRGRIPDARGTVELRVVLNSKGMVTEALVRGGSASPDVKAAFQEAAIGRSLLRQASGAQVLDLPPIDA